MIEILDDNFYKNGPAEIDLGADEKDPFVEYLHIKSRDIEVVGSLLDQEAIPYHIQQKSSFDETGLVPLTTNQLDNIKMAVFVPKSTTPRVSDIMKKYIAEKEAKFAEIGAWESQDIANIILVIIVIALIFVLVFVNFF